MAFVRCPDCGKNFEVSEEVANEPRHLPGWKPPRCPECRGIEPEDDDAGDPDFDEFGFPDDHPGVQMFEFDD